MMLCSCIAWRRMSLDMGSGATALIRFQSHALEICWLALTLVTSNTQGSIETLQKKPSQKLAAILKQPSTMKLPQSHQKILYAMRIPNNL